MQLYEGAWLSIPASRLALSQSINVVLIACPCTVCLVIVGSFLRASGLDLCNACRTPSIDKHCCISTCVHVCNQQSSICTNFCTHQAPPFPLLQNLCFHPRHCLPHPHHLHHCPPPYDPNAEGMQLHSNI